MVPPPPHLVVKPPLQHARENSRRYGPGETHLSPTQWLKRRSSTLYRNPPAILIGEPHPPRTAVKTPFKRIRGKTTALRIKEAHPATRWRRHRSSILVELPLALRIGEPHPLLQYLRGNPQRPGSGKRTTPPGGQNTARETQRKLPALRIRENTSIHAMPNTPLKHIGGNLTRYESGKYVHPIMYPWATHSPMGYDQHIPVPGI